MALTASMLERIYHEKGKLPRTTGKYAQNPIILQQWWVENWLKRSLYRNVTVVELCLAEEEADRRYQIHDISQEEARENLLEYMPWTTRRVI